MSKKNKRLRLENLEDRHMLAGQIFTSLANGVLSIEGDSQANILSIVAEGSESFSLSGNGQTTIDGEASKDFAGVKSIRIDMQEGNDSVYIGNDHNLPQEDAALKGFFVVDGREGNDTIQINGFWVKGKTFLRGQSGNDSIYIDESTFNRSVTILGQANRDLIYPTQSLFRSSVLLDGGNQNDTIYFGNQYVKIDGNMARSSLAILGGDGKDDLQIYKSNVIGEVLIDGGKHLDIINTYSALFRSNVDVKMGSGNDVYYLRDCRFLGAECCVDGSFGNDYLRGENNFFRSRQIEINGNAGDDNFGMVKSIFADPDAVTQLIGAFGKNDQLDFGFQSGLNQNIFRSQPVLKGWETST